MNIFLAFLIEIKLIKCVELHLINSQKCHSENYFQRAKFAYRVENLMTYIAEQSFESAWEANSFFNFNEGPLHKKTCFFASSS